MNWKVDPSDYMGHKYEQYKNKLLAKAMTTPSAYYDTRAAVLEKLNTFVAEILYKIFYDLLTKGLLPDGQGGTVQMAIGTEALVPNWPGQAATSFALEASETIDKILSECVEIILPKKHVDIATMKLSEKSNALTIK